MIYADISPRDLVEEFGEKVWKTAVPGREIAVLNGEKYLNEYKEDL